MCGMATIPEAVKVFAPNVCVDVKTPDGTFVPKGTTLAVLRGPSNEMLQLERPVLNIVGRLSGIATSTRVYHQAMLAAAGPDCKCKLLDTRKTTPGLRVLEKYAVRCGGGYCHRLGLCDAVLIKDNHLAGLDPDGVAQMVQKAADRAAGIRKSGTPIKFFEVEVDTMQQLAALLSLPDGTVDFILCDNFGWPASMCARTSISCEYVGGV